MFLSSPHHLAATPVPVLPVKGIFGALIHLQKRIHVLPRRVAQAGDVVGLQQAGNESAIRLFITARCWPGLKDLL